MPGEKVGYSKSMTFNAEEQLKLNKSHTEKFIDGERPENTSQNYCDLDEIPMFSARNQML